MIGRLGLRARVTVSFALGGLILSVVLAVLTFELVAHYLVSERETAAVRQAYVNARLVRSGLEATSPDISQVLASLETPNTSSSVIDYGGAWFSSSVAVDRSTIPDSLRALVANGVPGRQRYISTDGPVLAVGLPIPAVDGEYFEVFDLSDVQQALRALLTALVIAAVGTTLAGGVLGWWSSRRVLRPVAEVARAASRIATGQLDTRLPPNTDRDLAVLVASFNAMVASLAARIERDARFASDVSHELRSPLTTLAASAEVLRRHRDSLDHRAQRALDLLTADLDRFRQLVTDLLEISRNETAPADGSEEDVNVAELVAHTMASNGSSEIPLRIDNGAATVTVSADKRRLERTLANLLDNARDHAGGATGVSVAVVDHRVQIRVDDAGPGVPPGEREQIFERFARGSRSFNRMPSSGVGLGLAIVAEHAHRYGGRAWVESAPSGGARFVVELPARVQR